MMFSTKTHVISTAVFFSMIFSAGAFACSADGWEAPGLVGSVDVGQPFGASPPDVNGVSRFEELCALRASAQGHVQTNAPSHSRVRARMYVYPDVTGSTSPSNVLVAYDAENGTGELFHIAWDNGDWVVDANANGGNRATATASGGWDLIEVDWNPSGGSINVWINADATSEAVTFAVDPGGAATMESIRIGLPDGHGAGNSGNVFVDSVEMRNETAIGPLLNCDADANTIVEIDDAVAAVDELFVVALATGTPDCDRNGSVDVDDAVAIVDVIFGG